MHIYELINTKNILRPTSLPEMTNKVFLCIIEHLPLVAQQCYLDGCFFIYSLVSHHVLQAIIFYNKKFADKINMDLDIPTFS